MRALVLEQNVIRLVANGRLELSPIVTTRNNLNEVMQAIAQSGSWAGSKIMFYPQ